MPDAALGKAGRAACHPCYLRRRCPALARQARSSRIYPEFALPRLVGRELRITRRIRGVQCRPPGHSCPARRASRSDRVHGHPGLLLANPLARQAALHGSPLDHVTSWLQNAGRLRHTVADLAWPGLHCRTGWQVAGACCGQVRGQPLRRPAAGLVACQAHAPSALRPRRISRASCRRTWWRSRTGRASPSSAGRHRR